jgi:hypothetical protein
MQPTFHFGQLVRLRSPPAGETRTYRVTRILPTRDERASACLIKNMTGTVRVVKAQDVRAVSANTAP